MVLTVDWGRRVIAAVLLGLIRPVFSYCSNGDQVGITRCAQPLYDIGAFRTDTTSQTFSWDLFTQNEPAFFVEVCDAFIQFDHCTRPYKERCFGIEPMKSQYETATSVLDYLCHEGYRDMLHNFQCIVSTLRDDSMLQCQNEMLTNVQDIPDDPETVGREEQLCVIMRDYLHCMRSPLVRQCGIGAWSVVRDVVHRPTALIIPNCKVTNTSSANYTTTSFNFPIVLLAIAFVTLFGKTVHSC